MQHCCGCFLLHSLAASGLIAEPQKPQGCQPSRVGSLTDKRDEWTYKPNSVSRESPHGRRPSIWDGDCSTPQATYPECGRAAPAAQGRPPHAWSCSRCGIPSRPSYLSRWWSLTPPFHAYLQRLGLSHSLGRPVFCGTLPSGHPAWTLSSILLCGARTFLVLSLGSTRGRPAHSNVMPSLAPFEREIKLDSPIVLS